MWAPLCHNIDKPHTTCKECLPLCMDASSGSISCIWLLKIMRKQVTAVPPSADVPKNCSRHNIFQFLHSFSKLWYRENNGCQQLWSQCNTCSVCASPWAITLILQPCSVPILFYYPYFRGQDKQINRQPHLYIAQCYANINVTLEQITTATQM